MEREPRNRGVENRGGAGSEVWDDKLEPCLEKPGLCRFEEGGCCLSPPVLLLGREAGSLTLLPMVAVGVLKVGLARLEREGVAKGFTGGGETEGVWVWGSLLTPETVVSCEAPRVTDLDLRGVAVEQFGNNGVLRPSERGTEDVRELDTEDDRELETDEFVLTVDLGLMGVHPIVDLGFKGVFPIVGVLAINGPLLTAEVEFLSAVNWDLFVPDVS